MKRRMRREEGEGEDAGSVRPRRRPVSTMCMNPVNWREGSLLTGTRTFASLTCQRGSRCSYDVCVFLKHCFPCCLPVIMALNKYS